MTFGFSRRLFSASILYSFIVISSAFIIRYLAGRKFLYSKLVKNNFISTLDNFPHFSQIFNINSNKENSFKRDTSDLKFCQGKKIKEIFSFVFALEKSLFSISMLIRPVYSPYTYTYILIKRFIYYLNLIEIQ